MCQTIGQLQWVPLQNILAHWIWIYTGTISMPLVAQSEVGRNDEEDGSSSRVPEAAERMEINDIFVDSPLDIT